MATPAAPQTGALQAHNVRFDYWPGTRALAAALASGSALLTPLPGMPRNVLEGGRPIVVFVTPDERRFQELTRGRAPDWGAGVAFPDAGVIVLPGYGRGRGVPTQLQAILRHELAHVALQRRLGAARVPRWFTEGYAVWSARQLDADAAWLLRLAFVFNRAPPLDSLELRWPAESQDARVAYLLSATAVQYLYGLASPEHFERFLDAWARRGSLETALRGTYYLSSPQFERLWRRQVRSSYGWLLFLTQGVVLGLFFTAFVLVLFSIRRRRDRQRLAALRAAELPDDPAFWLEPPPGTAPPGADRSPPSP
ncbi:MAG: hypothetical protein FIB01_01900 [Gemmatimonadetes bacterium]|nr:hypothetical protein [Gemmatimonadota bacterium]